MTTKFLSVAGAALLATTSLVAAQSGQNGGTTIVPAGQSAPAVVAQAEPAKPAAPAAAPAEAGTAPAKAQAPTASEGAAPADGAAKPAADDTAKAADDAKPESDAKAADAEPASGEKAASDEGAASGEKKMSDVATMKVDKTPSADTVAEGNAVASHGEDGKPMDEAGNPTYEISADGTADWYTWRGYKKYGANCLQCHGPDGMGSSFAPNLTDQLQKIDYFKFAGIIVSGQQNQWNPSGNSIMPAWGEDPNVMCSMDAIYVYLRARADGVVGRGEPKRPPQTDETKAAKQVEYDCLGF